MLVFKNSISSVLALTAFLGTTDGFAMDVINDGNDDRPGNSRPVSKKSDEITSSDSARNLAIMEQVHMDVWRLIFQIHYSDNECTNPAVVRLVCKPFRNIINGLRVDTPFQRVGLRSLDSRRYVDEAKSFRKYYRMYKFGVGNEAACDQFLGGVVLHKPNPDNNEGMKELKIIDLANPFEGEFDLSVCGSHSQRMRTGYPTAGLKAKLERDYLDRKDLRIAPKTVTWLLSWHIINRNLTANAHYFQSIMGYWNNTSLIGILWTTEQINAVGGYRHIMNPSLMGDMNLEHAYWQPQEPYPHNKRDYKIKLSWQLYPSFVNPLTLENEVKAASPAKKMGANKEKK